jgi:predicted nucleic acid-binding protein
MIITIDTSALLAVLLNEQHKSAIIEATKGHDLQAPFSLDAEVGNALSAMFKRNRLSWEEARQVLAQFAKVPIRRTTLRLNEATEIAYKYNIYAYDAYVLDCARQYRSPLLSLDNQLKTIAVNLELNVLEVSP